MSCLLIGRRPIIPLIVFRHCGVFYIFLEIIYSKRRAQCIDKNDMPIFRITHRSLDLSAERSRLHIVLGKGKDGLKTPCLRLRLHPVDDTCKVIRRHRLYRIETIQKTRLQALRLERQDLAQISRLHQLIRLRLAQTLLVLLDLPLIAAEQCQIIRRPSLLTRCLDQNPLCLERLCDCGSTRAQIIIPLKHIGEILIRRVQEFDAAAQLLIHREQDQNRLEYRLLFLTQILLLLIGVQNHADMGCKICLSTHIEEIPELIHRQQRMLVIRARMIDEILECLDLLISNRLDKIKHTTLVRLERGCNMFENQCRHRMQGHDISDHILRRDARNLHHTTPRLMQTTIQIALHLRPVLCGSSFRLERCADEVKRDIVGQRNPDIDKAVARLLPRLICLRKEMIRLMRYGNEEERLCIHELRQFLKICQTLTIHAEIVREFIPDKDEFDIVLLNDIRQPRNQTINIELHHGKALGVRESRNTLHEVTHLTALAQTCDNILDHHPAERCRPLRLL